MHKHSFQPCCSGSRLNMCISNPSPDRRLRVQPASFVFKGICYQKGRTASPISIQNWRETLQASRHFAKFWGQFFQSVCIINRKGDFEYWACKCTHVYQHMHEAVILHKRIVILPCFSHLGQFKIMRNSDVIRIVRRFSLDENVT